MDEIYQYKQDDVVNFVSGPIFGIGKVCGIASNSLPLLGATYIINPIICNNLDAKVYPYSHLPVFESNLSRVSKQVMADIAKHGLHDVGANDKLLDQVQAEIQKHPESLFFKEKA